MTVTTARCLMIEMRDGRRIFTGRDNLLALMEFAHTFNARVSLVDATDAEVFEVEELPAAICDGSYQHRGTFAQVETVLPREAIYAANRPRKGGRPRSDTLTLANAIRGHIRQALLGRQTVSLRGLRERYKEHGLTASCHSGHLKLVTRTMIGEGFPIERTGHGCYRLANS